MRTLQLEIVRTANIAGMTKKQISTVLRFLIDQYEKDLYPSDTAIVAMAIFRKMLVAFDDDKKGDKPEPEPEQVH